MSTKISQNSTNDCVKNMKRIIYGESTQNRRFLFVQNDEKDFFDKKLLANAKIVRYL